MVIKREYWKEGRYEWSTTLGPFIITFSGDKVEIHHEGVCNSVDFSFTTLEELVAEHRDNLDGRRKTGGTREKSEAMFPMTRPFEE